MLAVAGAGGAAAAATSSNPGTSQLSAGAATSGQLPGAAAAIGSALGAAGGAAIITSEVGQHRTYHGHRLNTPFDVTAPVKDEEYALLSKLHTGSAKVLAHSLYRGC